jgi:hypothetical protein
VQGFTEPTSFNRTLIPILFKDSRRKLFILEGKMKRVVLPFFLPRISRIEEDFTDNIGLIYQISGTPNW